MVAAALAGCASPPRRPAKPDQGYWSGRLGLQVHDDPPQSISAAFELRGSPEQGELSLFTPLGGTAAILSWAAGTALLREQGKEPRRFPSIDALIAEVLGAPVPLAALFDWLAGRATMVPGWTADLSRQGRLHARRTEPLPAADLRIVLETP
nr:outer membrane lipoprotein LolB [Ramlibacter aurantiacus]